MSFQEKNENEKLWKILEVAEIQECKFVEIETLTLRQLLTYIQALETKATRGEVERDKKGTL